MAHDIVFIRIQSGCCIINILRETRYRFGLFGNLFELLKLIAKILGIIINVYIDYIALKFNYYCQHYKGRPRVRDTTRAHR